MPIAYDDALAEVKDLLNFTDTEADTSLGYAINRAFKRIHGRFIRARQGYYEADYTFNIVADTAVVTLSIRFIRIDKIYYVEDNSDLSELRHMPSLRERSRTATKIDSFAGWVEEGNNIRLNSIAATAKADGISIRGIAEASVYAATETIDLATNYMSWLVFGACYQYSLKEGDKQQVTYFKGLHDDEEHNGIRLMRPKSVHSRESIGFDSTRP